MITFFPNQSSAFLLGILFLLGLLSAPAQTVLYIENFNYPGGSGSTNTQSLNAAYGTNSGNELTNGWAGFSGATATDASGGAAVEPGAGIDISDRQSPSGPTSGSNQYGILIDSLSGLSVMATTPTGLSIDTVDQNLTFQWIQGDNTSTDHAQLAIELDNGQWYVSAATFTTAAQSAGSFAAISSAGQTQTLLFSATASNWNLLAFTPGSQLAIGSQPSANLSGHIIGFGFFITNASNNSTTKNNLRFDEFQITTTSTVSSPPVITSQPSGQTVTAGQSATFTVSDSNNPTGYQWYLNNASISGATGATYTISNAQAANAGTYYAVASNASGSAQSTSVLLTVNPVLNSSSPLSAFVNPFIGTDGGGNTYPGACTPRGSVQFSPDTYPTNTPGGYTYTDSSIHSFSMDHFSGRGVSYESDIGLMPVIGPVTQSPVASPTAFVAGYSHTNESASAGYYDVLLSSGPRVELTATPRTGMMQVTFPNTATQGSVIVNVGNSVNGASAGQVNIVNGNEVTGWAKTTIGGTQLLPTYVIYFSAVFDQPFTASGIWNGTSLTANGTAASGGNTGAYLTFNTSTNKIVHVKVGISWVSVTNAQLNRSTENPNWNFSATEAAAAALWNNMLGAIQINDPSATGSNLTIFYTALYHMLLHENIFEDVNGQYIGFDQATHAVATGHHHYTNIPGWDHYRSHSPLMALLFPNEYSDVAQSLIDDAEQTPAPYTGQVPRWVQENGNSNGMAGDGGCILIANAYAFGARNFDTATGLAVMLNNASVNPSIRSLQGDYSMGGGLPSYQQYGYVPEYVSVTLEYAVADMALAQFAQQLGRNDLYYTYANRAQNWQNIFNPNNLTISSRDSSGNWDAGHSNGLDLTWIEGTQAQYTWMLPFNLQGLFSAMGGNSQVVPRLDNFLSQINAGFGASYEYIGNEPGESQPWSYLYAGAPWETQAINRQIETQVFTNAPAGLPGNDDAGATSSWYVCAALGLYPMTSGAGNLVIGSPIYASTTVTLEGGQVLQINGTNAGAGNPYVQGMTINGVANTHLWLPVSTILNNSLTTLNFNLGSSSNTAWGALATDAPPSFGSVPSVISAASVQTQGTAGSLSLPLALTGTATIEPRMGSTSGSYSIAVTLSAPVTAATGTLQLQSGQGGTVVGTVQSTTVSGSTVTVNLAGVGNAQRLDIHLTGVQPGYPIIDVPINILWGDVNQNGAVSSADVNIVKSVSGMTLSSQNYLDDIKCSGIVSSSTVNTVKSLSGTALP